MPPCSLTSDGSLILSAGIPVQTEPPSIPIARFFPDNVYPVGEVQEYKDECAARTPGLSPLAGVLWLSQLCTLPSAQPQPPSQSSSLTCLSTTPCHLPRSQRWRTTSAECRERERLDADMYNDVRKASEIHRIVRKYMKSIIKPGLKLIDMCEVRFPFSPPPAATPCVSPQMSTPVRPHS